MRHWPFASIPIDGSDLDSLQRLADGEIQHQTAQTPYTATLSDQTRLLNDATKRTYLNSEIKRATDWGKLHSLYKRFEACASTLTAKISADGIPVPPTIVPFQKMMEMHWDTGNAQETAFFTHLSDFDRTDYSHDIDKKELHNALHKFVGAFVWDDETEHADGTVSSRLASNELPSTPTNTVVSHRFKALL